MAPFNVTCSSTFREDLAQIGVDDVRKDEAFAAVKDALSRNPHVGKVVEAGVRMIGAKVRQSFPIMFYYVIDGTDVRMIGVRPILM